MTAPNLDLFEQPIDPPKPPTGPPTDVAKFSDSEGGGYTGYLAWKETDDGQRAFQFVEDEVLRAAAAGEKRASTRTLIAVVRNDMRISVNDHYSAWMADDLVALHPELLEILERRRRRKPKL